MGKPTLIIVCGIFFCAMCVTIFINPCFQSLYRRSVYRQPSLDSEIFTFEVRLQVLATLFKTLITLYIPDCSRSTAQSTSTWQSCFHLFQRLYRFPLLTSEHSFLWHYFSLSQTLRCHSWSCLPRCSLCNQDDGLHCQYDDSAVFTAFP